MMSGRNVPRSAGALQPPKQTPSHGRCSNGRRASSTSDHSEPITAHFRFAALGRADGHSAGRITVNRSPRISPSPPSGEPTASSRSGHREPHLFDRRTKVTRQRDCSRKQESRKPAAFQLVSASASRFPPAAYATLPARSFVCFRRNSGSAAGDFFWLDRNFRKLFRGFGTLFRGLICLFRGFVSLSRGLISLF